MRVDINLVGKTIIIQFESLADNDDEVSQHALNTFEELAAAFNCAVNIREIEKHIQN